jgi:uncharacterized protein YbjT (DUF2867 family)
MKTALVFGSTGLVGSCLLNELITRTEYSEIKSFVRKAMGTANPKISENIIDFENLGKSSDLFRGDDVFICLGTTLKKAGSVAKVEEIDRDIPIKIAEICRNNGLRNIAIVSSIGANKNSKNYYRRIKGEMETGILNFGFANTAILRPSLLLGKRSEKRFAETISKGFMIMFGFLFMGKLKKFKAIHSETVARAMINILNQNLQEKLYESDRIQILGK